MDRDQRKGNWGPFQKGNPGMGDKAWCELHSFLARMHIKHAKKLAEIEKAAAKRQSGEKVTVCYKNGLLD